MTDFIDRAQLEAAMSARWEACSAQGLFPSIKELADAAIKFLDAETAEEWSHYKPARSGLQIRYPGRKAGNIKPEFMGEWKEESRRVTPWLPSEGGEKP